MKFQLKQFKKDSFGFCLIGFIFFLAFPNPTIAQEGTIFIRANKGVAYTNSGEKIRFKKMRETENSFSFITTNRTKVEVAKYKIAKIDKRNGNRGFQYMVNSIGLTTLFVIHTSYLDVYYTGGGIITAEEILFVSIILSAFTGTIGGLIGASVKKYKTIYSTDAFGNYEPNLKLKTTAPNAIPSLTLSYTF